MRKGWAEGFIDTLALPSPSLLLVYYVVSSLCTFPFKRYIEGKPSSVYLQQDPDEPRERREGEMCWENYRNPGWVDPWEFYDWPDYFSWEEWPHYQPYGPWCRMPFPHGPWIQQFGPPVTPDEEIAFLKDRARILQEELNAIEREISEFEQAA